MSSVVISGDTSGAITLQAPAVAGSTTLNLPASSGTVLTNTSTFAGTGPAFSAYQSSAQTINNVASTLVQINTEEFDTNSNYDTSTYRFTPTVAGYYQVNGMCMVGTNTGACHAVLHKNGVAYKWGSNGTTDGGNAFGEVSCLVYLNGSTDYISLYVYQSTGASRSVTVGSGYTYFQAYLAKAA